MKERPILFSGEMVKAILEGRKTMTRRAIKPQPPNGEGVNTCHYCESNWSYTTDGGACACRGIPNRYGHPGDRLWVKETFCELDTNKHGVLGINEKIVYRATNPAQDEDSKRIMKEYGYKWKPSIFMPRNASRITIEIIDTRVERLNDISVEDALAEGIIHRSMNCPKVEYRWLWEEINGAGTWDANPFVWVIEFKKLEGDQA
jgi:hypothetical protein